MKTDQLKRADRRWPSRDSWSASKRLPAAKGHMSKKEGWGTYLRNPALSRQLYKKGTANIPAADAGTAVCVTPETLDLTPYKHQQFREG